jgi:hypothetical protein
LLREAKFKLKTILGISDDFYSHCTSFRIYGTGQSSANSPVIWTIISFTTPHRSTTVHLPMVGFVHDSTGHVSCFQDNKPSTPENLAELTFCGSQEDNSSYLRARAITFISTDPILITDNKTGNDIPITLKSVLNTHKTLGN